MIVRVTCHLLNFNPITVLENPETVRNALSEGGYRQPVAEARRLHNQAAT